MVSSPCRQCTHQHTAHHTPHTHGWWGSGTAHCTRCTCVRKGGREEGRSNGGRKEGQEKRCPRCTRWACILATDTHCIVHQCSPPNPNLESTGRDTTEQSCTQRLRYRKFRQPSHCVSLAPQQLNMESHCSWHTNDSLTEWEENIYSVTNNK